MLELIKKIKLYTEAGIILEHMELFDKLTIMAKKSRNKVFISEKEFKHKNTGLMVVSAKTLERAIDLVEEAFTLYEPHELDQIIDDLHEIEENKMYYVRG